VRGEKMSNTEPSLPKLVRAYRALRDKRSENKTIFDAEDSSLKSKQSAIEQVLLKHCNDNGVTSVKTEEGVFYRKKKVSYWCSDWDKLHAFILKHEVPQILQKRISQQNLEEFLTDDKNKELSPEGLMTDAVYTITVQKPRGQ
tara:strand:- start:779 stop:1207 length:429 start_codon:yes stop_codon:yes gene_type:complete